jgi:hypothetical protein
MVLVVLFAGRTAGSIQQMAAVAVRLEAVVVEVVTPVAMVEMVALMVAAVVLEDTVVAMLITLVLVVMEQFVLFTPEIPDNSHQLV